MKILVACEESQTVTIELRKLGYEAYSSGIMNGWFTRNEAREREELNPIDGLDEPLVPLNMAVVGEEPVETGNTDAFIEDVAGRITMAEERGLSVRTDKPNDDRDRFNVWVNTFYEKQLCLSCTARVAGVRQLEDQLKVV